ncbi:hypothetical protein MNBD_CHLOROFLEXI01-3207 [hydrothermal vent metagenome]|uniref:Uncharacterized protein n=1 Tax=hydrothermal vent metagenome TaxID=652676 RepID=A0A3B0W0X8_9ZZZZ
MRWRIFLVTLIGLALVACSTVRALPTADVAGGTTYYVSQDSGSDGNTGTSATDAWQTVAKVNSEGFAPGDTVLFERGNSWDEDLDIDDSGTAVHPITFSSYGSGTEPIIRRLTIDGDYTVFENITIDHQKLSGDTVRVRAQNVTLRDMIVRNGASDGIDASDADGLLIDSVLIHHFLAGSFTNQQDAHGIVATDIQGLTIRNAEIHHVSGDSFQADPSRSVNVPMDILIEDAHFWTGPLDADFNDWNVGEVPGENAIDTKVADDDDWPTAARATFTIRNIVAHGWVNDDFISNRAVFNMKEKIEAVFDGVTVYDAEIGFRIRGTRGNANVTIQNAVFYNLEKGIRAEDDLQNLTVYNSTFGGGIDTLVQTAGGAGGVGSWEWLNNAFLDSAPPSQATDGSNKTAVSTDFVDAGGHDYHLAASSTLLDVGAAIAAVATDRDGNGRPQGSSYDVGAYEFVSQLQLVGSPDDETIFLTWSVNTTLPVTATWQIVYDGPVGDQPSPISGLAAGTRSYALTGLTNYTLYDVTLNAMLSGAPVLTDTVSVMPTDLLVYLPVVQK